MTSPGRRSPRPRGGVQTALRRALWPVRRVLAPAALEFGGELSRLRTERGLLHERVQELENQVAVLQEGLHEARRLNLRIAELTDLVTELVLPLHDREIDPAVLQRLRPDTV